MLTVKRKSSLARRSSQLIASLVLLAGSITSVTASEDDNSASDGASVLKHILSEIQNMMNLGQPELFICNPFPECKYEGTEADDSTDQAETDSSNNQN